MRSLLRHVRSPTRNVLAVITAEMIITESGERIVAAKTDNHVGAGGISGMAELRVCRSILCLVDSDRRSRYRV
jgi:hypothetical protein